jgi:hypothetical protein
MSAVIEDKGDKIDIPSSVSDAAPAESPAAERHESRAPPTRSWRERLRLPLMIGVPVIAGGVALYFYLANVGYESTDDAFLRAAQVSISPNVSARVIEVAVPYIFFCIPTLQRNRCGLHGRFGSRCRA